MKFLCESCKAKYQIPDEKVAGRTLRMTCRRCKNDIIIRGEALGAAEQGKRLTASSPAASRPRGGRSRGGSSVGPAPGGRARPREPRTSTSSAGPAPSAKSGGSALGAGFREQVAGDDRQPSRPPVREEWFVAINDVPVGPIHRDEIARKVGTGAVTEETLAWREGLDDWRPVKEIPALLALLRQRRVPAPPPRPAPRPVPRPAPRSNVIPIGGRMGAGPAAAPEDFGNASDEATQIAQAPNFAALMAPGAALMAPGAALMAPGAAAPAPAPVPAPAPLAAPASFAPAAGLSAPPPAASAPYNARRGAGIPTGAWIAIVGAGAFGITLAAMVAGRMMSNPQPVAMADPTAAPTAPVEPRPAQVALNPDPNAEDTAQDPSAEDPSAEDTAQDTADDQPTTERTQGHTTNRPQTGGTTQPTKRLSAEEQALLDRFGGSSEAAPSNLHVRDTSSSGGGNHGPLDAAQVRRVVTQNRPALQRCYDRAIRGRTDPPSVRMDVSLHVSAGGNVTSASATGADFGGLSSCLSTAVRHWRFPPSADGGETAFPVVFSSGG